MNKKTNLCCNKEEHSHNCGCNHESCNKEEHSHECCNHEEHSHNCGCNKEEHNNGCCNHEEHSHNCGCNKEEHNNGCCNHEEHSHSCECNKEEHNNGCCNNIEHSHSCGCGCSHNNNNTLKRPIIVFVLTLIYMIISMYVKVDHYIDMLIYAVLYLFICKDILISVIKNIRKFNFLDELFLMAIASIGAFFIGEMFEGIMVIIFYTIGEYLEHKAIDDSYSNILKLTDLKQDVAHKKVMEEFIDVKSSELLVGDVILVKSGEKIPVDGMVVSGSTYLDMKSLTGEAMLEEVSEKDSVISGSINTSSSIVIEVGKTLENSMVSKINNLIKDSLNNKSKSEKFITKFAKIYTPTIIALALLISLVLPLFDYSFKESIYKSLSFLLISCPCALVLSVPLTYFASIGNAAKNGILFKGANFLDTLNNVDVIFFDKTGTLTSDSLSISEVIKYDEQMDVLKYAASIAMHSNHVISKSLTTYYLDDKFNVSDVVEHKGMGVTGIINLKEVSLGNIKLMQNLKIDIPCVYDKTAVYVTYDNKYIGCVLFTDTIKDDAYDVIKSLNKYDLHIISGDTKGSVSNVCNKLGIKNYKAQLLPDMKVKELEEQKNLNKTILFVGDGINDAPSLALADVSMVLYKDNNDLSKNASDIVIMNNDILKVVKTFAVASFNRKIVRQNIIGILLIKFLIMLLAVFTNVGVIIAILADVGVSLLAILNSLRALKHK